MIVLNENDWAYEMIQSESLGRKPYETLCRVARYYIEEKEYSKKETRMELERFLIKCEPTASIPKWSNTLDRVMNVAYKYKSVCIDELTITKKEMELIDSLDSRQARRLAFTLLCLSKYWDLVSNSDKHWVNSKDSEIMRLANINTSIKRQSLLYHTLNEQGMIEFSKKVDNTNVRVLFGDYNDNSEIAMVITDTRNLGYQYMMYHGEPYFICENCGVTTKMRNPNVGRKQKYCTDCANKIKMQQIINSVMRRKTSQA